MPRHIIITVLKTKDKEKVLKAVKEKQCIAYRAIAIHITIDFSSEAMEARRKLYRKGTVNCEFYIY